MSNELRDMLAASDHRIKLQLKRTEKRLKGAPPLLAAIIDWVVYLRITLNLSRHTVCRYMAAVTEFADWLQGQGVTLEAVKPRDVERWVQGLWLHRQLGESSRKLYLQAVRGLFNWRELKEGMLSPAKQIKLPRVPRRMARRYSEKTLQALFGTCNCHTPIGKRDFALWLFLYATGARREEVEQLHLEQLEMSTRGGAARFVGKGAKERQVAFDRVVAEVLLDWLACRDAIGATHERVFVSLDNRTRGRALSVGSMEKRLCRQGKRTGIHGVEWGLHRFRVCFASDLYDSGTDLEDIRALMGHESIETTRRYIATSKRKQKHRLPGDRLREVTGISRGRAPIWLQRRLEAGGE